MHGNPTHSFFRERLTARAATLLLGTAAFGSAAFPNAMSAWDKAFLMELYHTSQVARHQRVEIAKRMLQDVTVQGTVP